MKIVSEDKAMSEVVVEDVLYERGLDGAFDMPDDVAERLIAGWPGYAKAEERVERR